MTIKRTVNGVEMEFELTGRELLDAYIEKQDEFDLQDVKNYFDMLEDSYLMEEHGFTRAELETMYEDMACRMRRYIDRYDCSWDYARDEAINDVINEHKAA